MEVDRERSEVMQDGRIHIGLLLASPTPCTLLHELLSPYGFRPTQTDTIIAQLPSAQSGRMWESETWTLLRDRDCLLLRQRSSDVVKTLILPTEGEVNVCHGLTLSVQVVETGADFIPPRSPQVVCLDWDLLCFPLQVRPVREGDRFVPFGMTGSKLVSDFLTNLKLDRFAKKRQTAVCTADGRIAWLTGLRPDNRFRITAHTRRALMISSTI